VPGKFFGEDSGLFARGIHALSAPLAPFSKSYGSSPLSLAKKLEGKEVEERDARVW